MVCIIQWLKKPYTKSNMINAPGNEARFLWANSEEMQWKKVKPGRVQDKTGLLKSTIEKWKVEAMERILEGEDQITTVVASVDTTPNVLVCEVSKQGRVLVQQWWGAKRWNKAGASNGGEKIFGYHLVWLPEAIKNA